MSTPNHPSPVTFSNVFIHSIQWSHQDAPVVVRLLRKTAAGDTYDTALIVLPPEEARRAVPSAMFTRLKLVVERFNPARKFAARPGLTCVVGRVTSMDSASGALYLQDVDWEPGEAFRPHRLFGCHDLNTAGFELNDEVLIWFVPDSDEKPDAAQEPS